MSGGAAQGSLVNVAISSVATTGYRGKRAVSCKGETGGSSIVVSEDVQGRVTKKVCLACNREFTGLVQACPHDGTVLIPLAQDQLVGTKLADRYLIMSVIGHGGMGVVYKAKHELMDRVVAIKMLLSQLIADSMSVKRFQQEAKAACRLKHPNVITLYDFGVSPAGQPYLVMDYLEGVSLADVIKKEGQVSVDRCIRIFTQACEALDHAHHQGVIHRDLKPGNIMLVETEDEKDFVKVVDFGVAKLMGSSEDGQRLTQTGEVCGSPVYMSPEQCRGEKLDARSDIYSMGVVIYETLTGKLPLLGKTMVDTMSKHITEMPPSFNDVRPDLYIPERLEAVVFRALQKDPEERQQSMAQMAQDLQFAVPKPGKSSTLRTAEMASVTKVPMYTSAKTSIAQPQKAALPVAAIGAVVAVVVAAAGLLGWMLNHPMQQPPAPPPSSIMPRPAPLELAPKEKPDIPHTPAVRPVAPQAPEEPVSPRTTSGTKPAGTTRAITPVSRQQASQASHAQSASLRAHAAAPHITHKTPAAATHAVKPAASTDPFEALKHSRSY